MKVLITGGSGFIGSNLVTSLLDKNYEIYVLTRTLKQNKHSKIKYIRGDLTNISSLDQLRNIIKEIDIIFNLAGALPHHHLSDNDYWQVNTVGVKNLLDICKHSKMKRFVHVSTTGIYDTTTYANEESESHLDSAYTKSKAEGEKIVYSYYKKKNFPITIIRPTIAYGQGDTRPGFSNLFPLIKKRLFIPVGRGKNFFHTIYIGNLVEALILAATKKEAIGEDFIIGDDPCPTMKQIINTIAKVEGVKIWPFYLPQKLSFAIGFFFDFLHNFGIPSILNTQRVKFITENKKFDISKAKTMLGYKAKYNLTEGVQKTYDWYREKGLL